MTSSILARVKAGASGGAFVSVQLEQVVEMVMPPASSTSLADERESAETIDAPLSRPSADRQPPLRGQSVESGDKKQAPGVAVIDVAVCDKSPLILAGLAWAGINAARADWRPCGVGVGVAVVGAVGLFAGRAGAWAVVGVGLFIVLLGSAVAIVWQQRRSVVWP